MRYFLLSWMTGIGVLVLSSTASAQTPEPCDYLLLKSGAVLTGRVTLDGQTYIVRSATSGGESRYPTSMVAKLCSSATEVYSILKKYSVDDDASDHCRLAKFCLTHKLMKEARHEIDEAFKYERRSPEAQVLLKQWTAMQQAPPKPSDEIPALPYATIPLLPASPLEEWPAVMAPAGFQDFTHRLQPLLLVGCGTGACHGTSEGKRGYILRRALPGMAPSPVMCKTNLERTLGLVDRDNPDASELLKRARQPHGNVKHWTITQDHQSVLRQWVLFVCGKQELARQTDQPASQQKASNQFASGDNAPVNPVEPGKLPAIPGLSGSAIQQTGATNDQKAANEPERTPPQGGSGFLPPIPGVSGKGQGKLQSPAAPVTPPQNEKPPEQSAADKAAQQAALHDYARRMGVAPPIPAPTTPLPQRLKIVNAGNYRIDLPPLLEFSEEVKEMLRRQDAIKNGETTDTTKPAMLFRSGTIVSSPPK